MATITVKNEEAKTITFTIQRDNTVLDVSAATGIDFVVKDDYDDTSYLIEKNIGDFDTSQASVGIVSCTLTTTDLAYATIPGTPDGRTYRSELRIVLTASTDVDISANIEFVVERSLFA